jgi:protein-disulfide isomerase
MKSKAVMEEFNYETEEAQKYNLSGTPGVIIINTKTLKYDTVEGAYPIETFHEKIDTLLK